MLKFLSPNILLYTILLLVIFASGERFGSWRYEKYTARPIIAELNLRLRDDEIAFLEIQKAHDHAQIRWEKNNSQLAERVHILTRENSSLLRRSLDEISADTSPELDRPYSFDRTIRLCITQARAQGVASPRDHCSSLAGMGTT